jgi:hypothetical protein
MILQKWKNNSILRGNNMIKHILLISLLSFCYCLKAQSPIEVGKAVNNTYVITADTTILRKALQNSLTDGTVIRSMRIESVGKWHYLIGVGIQKNYSKTIAVELSYNINTQTYYAVDGLAHKTCASAGCSDCDLFKEKGNIIGCHCKTENSVSNECNFKTVTQSPFYYQYSRYLKMKKG